MKFDRFLQEFTEDMPSGTQEHIYDYYIDDQGSWFCEGNPVTDTELFEILSRSLFEKEGRYFVRCEGETHPVRVADAPLWVRYVHILTEPHESCLRRVEIQLQDGRREEMDARTLTAAKENALYCLATRRRLKARFGKVAYYELTRFLMMDSDGESFFFIIGGKRYDIRSEPQTR